MTAAGRTGLALGLLLFASAGSPAADVDRHGDPLPPGAVARLGTIRLSSSQVLKAVAYSPNGKLIASTAGAGYYRVFDAVTGQLQPDPADADHNRMHDRVVASISGRAISADGRLEAVGTDAGEIQFSEWRAVNVVQTLKYPGDFKHGQFEQFAFARDEKALVSLTTFSATPYRTTCQLWDRTTGKITHEWADVCRAVAVSPDGKVLALGADKPSLHVQLWDLATCKEIRRFELPKPESSGREVGRVSQAAAFSPDGKRLAVADLNDRVHVWDVATGQELFAAPAMTGWYGRVQGLAFSPDGTRLAVAAWHRILIWDAATGKDLLPLTGHANQVGVAVFSPDGATMATRSEEATILWDAKTWRARRRFTNGYPLLGFAPEGDLLWGHNGLVLQCRPDTGKVERATRVYKSPEALGVGPFQLFEPNFPDDVYAFSAVFSPDGKTMLTGSRDRTVRRWDRETGQEVWRAKREDKDRRFPADVGGHWPLGFGRDGKTVLTVADDAVLRFYDAATGQEQRWVRIDSRDATLSPDGRFLIAEGSHVAAADGRSETSSASPPRYYDLANAGNLRPTELYPQSTRGCRFSPDGKAVALAVGAEVVLLDWASKKQVRRLKGHGDHILGLAFSPDGKFLVSSSYDLTALVWDLR